MEKPTGKSKLRAMVEFFAVYMLSAFLILFAYGYSPRDKIRFFFASLLITVIIIGAYEIGRDKNNSV